ncbi:MAG TPA: MBL fold metallo-hydrolase [Syntrophales bacterium]|nr:MBL fold metallo-hydrolase [Syntrophales bacterium]HPQ45389.1 MBL fold metallo-hydrolase [Syntrophales bacterium]
MILEQTGKICNGLYSTGFHFMPAFLLTSQTPVLFDAGVTALGPQYLKDIRMHLGSADRLGHIFLTHSHFDHCGACPFLTRKIQGLKIAASAHAAQVLEKPGAVKLIRTLSKTLERKFGDVIGNEDVSFAPVTVDLILHNGDTLDFGGGWIVRVIETPGHTRDSLSFYIPRIKTLIAGEAVGLYSNQGIQPEFSSSYTDYMASLEKLSSLDIDILATAHVFVLTGEDARQYIGKSIASTVAFKERIERHLNMFGGDREKVVEAMFQEDYDITQPLRQDRTSFLLNLQAKVRVIAEKK